jgi:histidine triad (HIT) family protein
MSSLFTKILTGELPGHFVWKDEVCFAVMTIQPIRAGHVIVIPNQEVNHWDEVSPATAAYLMQVGQHIAKAIKASVTCKRVGVMVVGLEVPHTHMHLIPIDSLADMDFKNAKAAPQDALATMATTLRAALTAAGHKAAQLA